MSLRLMDAVVKRGPERMLQRFVLLTLAKLAGRDGSVQVPVRVLMGLTGGDNATVSLTLNELRQGGWVTRTTTGQLAPPTYQISFHRLGMERLDPLTWTPRPRLCAQCSAPVPNVEGQA